MIESHPVPPREIATEARGRTTRHDVQLRRVYTLGELAEMVRERKVRARQRVESGDVDGEEPEIDEQDILLRPRRARGTR